MKKILAVLTVTALLGASTQTQAGDREWATAGKVLTGVVAGAVLAKALEPAPVYQTVTYATPAPVVVQSAPVYVAQPAIVQPPPVVVYRPAPIYVAPAPTVIYRPGYYRHHYHRGHHGHHGR